MKKPKAQKNSAWPEALQVGGSTMLRLPCLLIPSSGLPLPNCTEARHSPGPLQSQIQETQTLKENSPQPRPLSHSKEGQTLSLVIKASPGTIAQSSQAHVCRWTLVCSFPHPRIPGRGPEGVMGSRCFPRAVPGIHEKTNPDLYSAPIWSSVSHHHPHLSAKKCLTQTQCELRSG